jgi:hypothetical protein
MSQQGQPVEAERPPNRLQILDHQIGSEPQRVGHLGAAAPALVEVEQGVAAGQRVEILPKPSTSTPARLLPLTRGAYLGARS